MKYILFFFVFFLISTHGFSQLNAGDSKDAWQRKTYKKWDDFNPKFYMWINGAKYKKDDKRSIYALSGMMRLWGVYADEWEMRERSVDSVLKQETYKALDRKLSKNYIVLQKPQILEMYEKGEDAFLRIKDTNIPEELENIVRSQFDGIRTNIDFIANSNSPDIEKFELIAEEMKELKVALEMAQSLEGLAAMFLEDFSTKAVYDFSDVINLNLVEINSLIKN